MEQELKKEFLIMQTPENYKQLAFNALDIMKIRYSKDESIEKLVSRIRYAMPMPSIDTEFEINRLTVELSDAIEKNADVDDVVRLLEELDFEVSFLLWD